MPKRLFLAVSYTVDERYTVRSIQGSQCFCCIMVCTGWQVLLKIGKFDRRVIWKGFLTVCWEFELAANHVQSRRSLGNGTLITIKEEVPFCFSL